MRALYLKPKTTPKCAIFWKSLAPTAYQANPSSKNHWVTLYWKKWRFPIWLVLLSFKLCHRATKTSNLCWSSIVSLTCKRRLKAKQVTFGRATTLRKSCQGLTQKSRFATFWWTSFKSWLWDKVCANFRPRSISSSQTLMVLILRAARMTKMRLIDLRRCSTRLLIRLKMSRKLRIRHLARETMKILFQKTVNPRSYLLTHLNENKATLWCVSLSASPPQKSRRPRLCLLW